MSRLLPVLLLAASAAGCGHGTELVLLISVGPGVDPAAIDGIRVTVTEGSSSSERYYYIQDQLADGETDLSIRPEGTVAVIVRVDVAAFGGGGLLAAATIPAATIEPDQASFFALELLPALDPNCILGPWSPPSVVSEISTPGEESSPFLSADGLRLYFTAFNGSAEMDFHVVARTEPAGPFSSPVALSDINGPGDEYYIWLSPDELEVYYASDAGNASSLLDLWSASRTSTAEAFSNAGILSGVSDVDAEDLGVWVSPDGLTLWFSSTRWGDLDIGIATRASISDPFGSAGFRNEFFTGNFETAPSLLPDQLTIFYAADTGGQGGMDIFTGTRDDLSDEFTNLQSVPGINTPFDEWDPSISPDGRTLYFSSDRPGGGGDFDIWFTTRSCL